MLSQSDGYDTTKKQREDAGRIELKIVAERWAGRSFLAVGYRESYVASAGLRTDH